MERIPAIEMKDGMVWCDLVQILDLKGRDEGLIPG
jgi:hypothetical protein